MTAAAPPRPKFHARSELRADIERRVEDYFARTGLSRTGGPGLALKALVIFAWVAASYGLLVFWAASWWTALPLAVSLGLALAGVGFAVMHDGGHGASFRHPWLNRLAASSLDLMGGSSYVWNQKHNVLHHTFTNVDGVDDDIEMRPFFRMAPSQPLRWGHRFQHLYFPLLMVFFTTKWALYDDFYAVAKGEVGGQRVPRPGLAQMALLLAGKLSFLTWGIVVPLMVRDVVPYLIAYTVVVAVWGITMGVVFQLAHAVEGAAFADVPAPGERLARPWAEHQLATTVDFAPNNPVLTWYLGGLNFQVEHHLFPRISHRHYPAIARIVRETCAEHGVPHLEHATFFSALGAHLRYMARMGRPEATAAPALVS